MPMVCTRHRPPNAAELAHAKVDVIVTQGTEVTDAARKATTTIPIVMAAIGDAVGAGIVEGKYRCFCNSFPALRLLALSE